MDACNNKGAVKSEAEVNPGNWYEYRVRNYYAQLLKQENTGNGVSHCSKELENFLRELVALKPYSPRVVKKPVEKSVVENPSLENTSEAENRPKRKAV